jgi:hypothetical protein
MRSKNSYNNNTLFLSKETINTTEKSTTCQKLILLTIPTLLLVGRAPFDLMFPVMPKRTLYQLQADTNFKIFTL